MEVSVPMQKIALYKKGILSKTYPISTSKFGLGNTKGSYKTPLGKMEVVEKIGRGKPSGAVFKSRKWTGQIVKPDSGGRDPIVSRILRLKGLEKRNSNTFSRCVYIHGTAAERHIGKPVSYGCIRMKSKDVIDLFRRVDKGAIVYVSKNRLSHLSGGAQRSEEDKAPVIRKKPSSPGTVIPEPLRPASPIKTSLPVPRPSEVAPGVPVIQALDQQEGGDLPASAPAEPVTKQALEAAGFQPAYLELREIPHIELDE